jgi:NADH-quinone oxidoreductase subunit C
MTAAEIHATLDAKFPGKITGCDLEAPDPWVEVEPASLLEVMSVLKEEEGLAFDALMCLSGVDHGAEGELGVTWHLYSTARRHRFTVKVRLPRERPVVASVASLWRTADWHEREAYDLLGITFEGHPDLTRILLPEDWEGHPLRKDYVLNKTYHGIRFKD